MTKTASTSKKKDSRIGKTDRDIKRAMLSLVAKEPFDRIRVEQIMAEAPVTKVTFYRHFTSKDDVLDAIRVDLVDDMITEFNTQPYKNLAGGGISILSDDGQAGYAVPQAVPVRGI